MTYDFDRFPSKEHFTNSDWLLQIGDAPNVENSHIDIVRNAVESLDDTSRQIVEAIFYERIPYSQLGTRLGFSKVHAWRLTKKALGQLERVLHNNYSINMRYNMFTCWDDAAEAIINDMDGFLPSAPTTIGQLNGIQQRLATHVREAREIPIQLLTSIGDNACSQMKHDGTWRADVMHRLLVGKQRDYGHENILLFGLTGVAVRVCDKVARLKTLTLEGYEPTNESLLDTWRDLVGYSVIGLMLWNGTFKLELKEEE